MTQDDAKRSTPPRAAWREPMVWLVFAIPAAAVVATVSLLVVAARSSGSNDLVADDVQRTAQVQVTDLGPDAEATRLQLRALVRSSPGMVEVVPVGGAFDRNASLALALHHPLRAGLDRKVTLLPTATGWQSDAKIDLDHDWNVQLRSTDGRWRLQGRWVSGQHAVLLRPALDRAP
jgi:hypothetical protein